MRQLRFKCLLCLLILCAACSGLASEPEIIQTLPPRSTAAPESFGELANIQAGALIYAQRCASCHGVSGAGDGELVAAGQVADVPDFTAAATIEDRSLQAWFDVITDGRLEALMPPWRDALSPAERWEVALYTYTLAYDAALVAQGEALYNTTCAACHGQAGYGTDDGPSLVGLVDFTEADLRDMLRAHPADTPPLESDDDRRAVVQYLRLLSTTTRTLPGEVGPLVRPAATEEVTEEIAEEVGTIRGRVIQGTPGGADPAALPVALSIIGQQQVMTTRAADDGSYLFDEVIIRPDYAYTITVSDHDGVRFTSELYPGNSANPDMTIDMSIYERAADESVIEVTSRAVQVNLTPHGLYMIEVITLTNTSDTHMYLRDHDEYSAVSVAFPLADSVHLETGHTDTDRLLLSADGRQLFDTQPVLPGVEHYVQFSYLLTLTNNTVISLLPLAYTDHSATELFVDFNHLTLQGDGIEFSRIENFGGDLYRVYTVTDAPQAGETASFRVARVAGDTGVTEANPGQILAALMIISGVGLLGAAVFLVWQQRRQPATAED